MKKLIFTTLILVCFHFNSFSQEKNSIQGTYQIQVINTRDKPFIPANLNEMVTKNRKENETVYLQLGTFVRLMILPENEIKRKDFTPLKEIQYISQ